MWSHCQAYSNFLEFFNERLTRGSIFCRNVFVNIFGASCSGVRSSEKIAQGDKDGNKIILTCGINMFKVVEVGSPCVGLEH